MVYARDPVIDAFSWLHHQGFELVCRKELASEKHVDALPCLCRISSIISREGNGILEKHARCIST